MAAAPERLSGDRARDLLSRISERTLQRAKLFGAVKISASRDCYGQLGPLLYFWDGKTREVGYELMGDPGCPLPDNLKLLTPNFRPWGEEALAAQEFFDLPAEPGTEQEVAMPVVPKTRSEIYRREMTRDPIFLLQVRYRDSKIWHTETVFLDRVEGETWAAHRAYRWHEHRVYCVPAEGKLAELLKSLDSLPVVEEQTNVGSLCGD